jgi:hypothetical protein
MELCGDTLEWGGLGGGGGWWLCSLVAHVDAAGGRCPVRHQGRLLLCVDAVGSMRERYQAWICRVLGIGSLVIMWTAQAGEVQILYGPGRGTEACGRVRADVVLEKGQERTSTED